MELEKVFISQVVVFIEILLQLSLLDRRKVNRRLEWRPRLLFKATCTAETLASEHDRLTNHTLHLLDPASQHRVNSRKRQVCQEMSLHRQQEDSALCAVETHHLASVVWRCIKYTCWKLSANTAGRDEAGGNKWENIPEFLELKHKYFVNLFDQILFKLIAVRVNPKECEL